MSVSEAKLLKTIVTQTIESPEDVFGLAVLDRKLYVLRKRQDKQIDIYDTKDYSKLEPVITVQGLSPSYNNDMTECKTENCLFVSDFSARCIRKVDAKGKVSKFVDVPYEKKVCR